MWRSENPINVTLLGMTGVATRTQNSRILELLNIYLQHIRHMGSFETKQSQPHPDVPGLVQALFHITAVCVILGLVVLRVWHLGSTSQAQLSKTLELTIGCQVRPPSWAGRLWPGLPPPVNRAVNEKRWKAISPSLFLNLWKQVMSCSRVVSDEKLVSFHSQGYTAERGPLLCHLGQNVLTASV